MRSKNAATSLLLAWALAMPATARAELRLTPPAAGTFNGAWMDDAGLRKCLAAQIAADAAAGRERLYQTMMTEYTEELAVLRTQTDDDHATISRLAVDAKADQVHRAALQKQVDAWYHNPFIMAGVGAAFGVLGTTAIVMSFR